MASKATGKIVGIFFVLTFVAAILSLTTSSSATAQTSSDSPATSQSDGANASGYWLTAADGGIFGFGNSHFYGSTGSMALNSPVVSMKSTSDGLGYWTVAADGGIFNFGDAKFLGSMGSSHLNAPVVAMAATPSGNGYWLAGADGGIFAFGDARFYGSMDGQRINAPIIAMESTTTGNGYWLLGRDGGVFAFGDARFFGSTGSQHLNAPVVGIRATSDGAGYWFVASDGGVFNYGDANFYGSAGDHPLNKPIADIARTGDGKGYWLVATDGGVFAYGDAKFLGSLGAVHLNAPIISITASTSLDAPLTQQETTAPTTTTASTSMSPASTTTTVAPAATTTTRLPATTTTTTSSAKQSTSNSDSTTYLNNAQHTSIASPSTLSPALKNKWNKTFPGVLWYSLIVNNRIYVVSQNSLYALDKDTGADVWGPVTNLGNGSSYGPLAAIAYDNGKIFVTDTGIENNGYHEAKAFDAATGKLLWGQTEPTSNKFQLSDAWNNPPVAANGVLYVTGSSGDSILYAISETTGATLWTLDYPNGSGSTPAISNNNVFYWYGNSATGSVTYTGTSNWVNQETGTGGIIAAPVLVNGTIWEAAQGGNQTVDAATGKVTGTFASEPMFAPIITNDVHLFYKLTPLPGTGTAFDALEAESPGGTILWRFGDEPLVTQPVVANGVVYVSAESGNTWGLDIHTGKVLWSTNVGSFDVQNQFSLSAPVSAIGDGVLVIPAGRTLQVFGN